MNTVVEQFLQYLEKDRKDWEAAAAFFEQIRTVTMGRARVRERMELPGKIEETIDLILGR